MRPIIGYVKNKDQVKNATADCSRKLTEDKAEVGGTAQEQGKQAKNADLLTAKALQTKQKRLRPHYREPLGEASRALRYGTQSLRSLRCIKVALAVQSL